ncbi:MAG: hypothetical protein HZB42_12740 [Sphingobacteriales bacterium]|nr:hypothetical protein [Sphingobacteriales bacterium]
MKRNDFIKRTIAGTLSLFAVNWAAFGRKKEIDNQDKPILTDGALNRFFAKCNEENNLRPYDEAISNTRAFIEKYFNYVSTRQQERIRQFGRAEWRGIRGILSDAKLKKGIIDFKFINKPGVGEEVAECQILVKLLQNGPRPEELKKFIIG